MAAGHPQTAAAGIEILRQGGNAFDAAIAALLAACVAEATLTSLGGAGFLLAHTATGESVLFDFFSQTPGERRSEREVHFYPVAVDFGDAVQEFHIGPGSMAVPGTVAGVFHIHGRLGRLPMAKVAAPAIELARRGLEIDPFQSFCRGILEPILLATPGARALFVPQGHLQKPGEPWAAPELADTLDWLVAEGPDVFYRGEIAHRLVADSERLGGHLTAKDLRTYRVIEREPLRWPYRDRSLLTNPAPSAGGTLICFALQLLSHFDIGTLRFGTAAHLELLTEVMRLTDEARRADFKRQDNTFLSPVVLDRYGSRLRRHWGSTTHISVLDAEGNAASVTSTNGEGSAYVIPGTGIMINNMLGEEDLHPEGFDQWPVGRRIASMMAPSIVLRDGEPEIVLGSGGSKRIRTALLQVLANLIDFQMPLAQAIASPRIHWENHILHLEPDLQPPLHLEDSSAVLWREQNFYFGGVHTVRRTGQGLEAEGDHRRSGTALLL
ncbi:gamma-glutamyltransferase family protein [Gloeobacter kilaueensis]|uniref:gamma-glutamyltransferase family protein n=1 Tax=Gloeobacter kilaueensis TaxID=1416614 RepID=UPI0003FB5BD5|nr:gamma-glutamyltransferase [Gloeobacter kilaueensis]